MPINGLNRIQYRLDFICNGLRVCLAIKVARQNHELVASQAGERIAPAHPSLQGMGKALQQQVSYSVPICIVDLFEPVQFNEQQSRSVRFPVLSRKDACDGLLKALAIAQTRQRVGRGSLLEPVDQH